MSRLLWFSAGMATGTYATLRVRRVLDELSPAALRDRMRAVGAGLQVFADEARIGMAEREQELWQAIDSPSAPRPAELSSLQTSGAA